MVNYFIHLRSIWLCLSLGCMITHGHGWWPKIWSTVDHREDVVHDWCFSSKRGFYIHINAIQGVGTESLSYTLWNEKAVGNGIRSAICCSQVTQLHTSTFPFSANVLCWIKLHSWNSCGWRFAEVHYPLLHAEGRSPDPLITECRLIDLMFELKREFV